MKTLLILICLLGMIACEEPDLPMCYTCYETIAITTAPINNPHSRVEFYAMCDVTIDQLDSIVCSRTHRETTILNDITITETHTLYCYK